MTTTTPTAKAEELRERLASHRDEIARAGQQIAAATLDGTSSAAASKRLAAARDAARSTTLALSELERREEEAAAQQREVAVTTERLLCDEWFAAYLRAAEEVIRLRDLAAEAEKRLQAGTDLPESRRKILRAQMSLDGLLSSERDIDAELVSVTTDNYVLRLGQVKCRELRDRAEALAAEERRRLDDLRQREPEALAA